MMPLAKLTKVFGKTIMGMRQDKLFSSAVVVVGVYITGPQPQASSFLRQTF